MAEETLAQRAGRLYDQNGPGTALFVWNSQLAKGTRKISDELDDLWRAAIAEANGRDWRHIHKPTADEFFKKARTLFITYYAAKDE